MTQKTRTFSETKTVQNILERSPSGLLFSTVFLRRRKAWEEAIDREMPEKFSFGLG